jgi:hypothetical protein
MWVGVGAINARKRLRNTAVNTERRKAKAKALAKAKAIAEAIAKAKAIAEAKDTCLVTGGEPLGTTP